MAALLVVACAAVVCWRWDALRAAFEGDAARPIVAPSPSCSDPDLRILFLGNSLTYYNNLDRLVAALGAASPAWRCLYTARYAPGGYRLAHHLRDLARSTSRLKQLLDRRPRWDWVVIQGQSQIPGFAADNRETRASFAAALKLHRAIVARGSRTALFATFGHWRGDAHNRQVYPDFVTMTAKLTAGYQRLAKLLAADQPQAKPPVIVPVGAAFRAIYDEVRRGGRDPLAAGTVFRRLYVDDRHPALAGSYLAAAVFVAKLSGRSLTEVGYRPAQLDAGLAVRLRRVADQVVAPR